MESFKDVYRASKEKEFPNKLTCRHLLVMNIVSRTQD